MAGKTRRRTAVQVLACATWGYAVLVAVACAIMYGWGDRWWPATLLLFGPRWVAAFPLVILIPLALWLDRRLLIPLILATTLVFGPLMGLRLPRLYSDAPPGKIIRVITCNVHGGDINPQALTTLIRDTQADVVALQETGPENNGFTPVGWHVLSQRGLMLMSRFPFKSNGVVQTVRVPFRWPGTSLLYGIVETGAGEVTLCSVHLPTPRYGIKTVLDKSTVVRPSRSNQLINETWHRAATSRVVRAAVDALPRPVVVVGDFNMPVESTMYRRMWGGFENAFDLRGKGFGFSQRVSVRGIPIGVRIDHVLAGPDIIPKLCEVGPDIGSDHLPVIADLMVSGTGNLK